MVKISKKLVLDLAIFMPIIEVNKKNIILKQLSFVFTIKFGLKKIK